MVLPRCLHLYWIRFLGFLIFLHELLILVYMYPSFLIPLVSILFLHGLRFLDMPYSLNDHCLLMFLTISMLLFQQYFLYLHSLLDPSYMYLQLNCILPIAILMDSLHHISYPYMHSLLVKLHIWFLLLILHFLLTRTLLLFLLYLLLHHHNFATRLVSFHIFELFLLLCSWNMHNLVMLLNVLHLHRYEYILMVRFLILVWILHLWIHMFFHCDIQM